MKGNLVRLTWALMLLASLALTVGAGIRPPGPSPAQPPELAPERVAGSPGIASPGSPPVREFHPPPKVTEEPIPHCRYSHKEAFGFTWL